MIYENLPAKNVDETDAIVKITNRKLNKELKEGTIFEIPADSFVYPQVESVDEMNQICGGDQNVLKIFNRHLRNEAVAEAKDSIRMASTGTQDDIIEAGITKGKNFTFIEQATITAAEAKEAVGNLRALVAKEQLTDAELAERVRKMFNL